MFEGSVITPSFKNVEHRGSVKESLSVQVILRLQIGYVKSTDVEDNLRTGVVKLDRNR